MVNGVPKIADFGYSSCYIRAYEIRDTQLNHGNVMQYTLIINFIIADRLIQETVNYSLFHLMKSDRRRRKDKEDVYFLVFLSWTFS